MLQKSQDIKGYKVHAADGNIGHVDEFFFDEEELAVRYIIVDTGVWVFGRKVLLMPQIVDKVDWDDKKIKTGLTKEQIKNSPDIDRKKPISRLKEAELYKYYNLPVYWTGMGFSGGTVYPGAFGGAGPVVLPELAEDESLDLEVDSHLRSTEEVKGYAIQAKDDMIGHVDDFLIEDINWKIRYLIVDTKDFLPGKDVIISPYWIDSISWMEQKVYVNLPKEKIENAPEYDKKGLIDRNYEDGLFEYYGSIRYWL